MIVTQVIETAIGPMIAGATVDGICLLEFTDRRMLPAEQKYLEKKFRCSFTEGENNHTLKIKEELAQYFEGSLMAFTVPLVTPGTPFQVIVWKELLKIPYGSTRSYQEQSLAVGNTGSVRAVARANGMNRISIIIPCHRVIGSDGSLTGYGGGLHRKKWLIDHERKHSGKPVDMVLF